jgi:tRNA-modifying protein YgfZ
MSPAPFPLKSLRSIAVAGADARGFLQGQLSANLDEVTPARGQLSAWHDPKGRVLAVFRVLPCPDGFLLVTCAALAATLAQRLRMFVLRAQVTLQAGPPVYGLAAGCTTIPPGANFPELNDEPLSAACGATVSVLRLPGRAGWLIAGELATVDAPPDSAAAAAWERAELEAGIPEIYPETSGIFVAQMLNLDRIAAVSFTKGCFPGQEIVARAHHLGRVKRRARLFRCAGAAPAPGESLAESTGTVVRAAPAADHCLVMAVVAEDADGPFALADGRPLESFPV